MNLISISRSSRLVASVLFVVCAVLGAREAAADDVIALDYQAKAPGCPSADRFADEIAAKLGFVPWGAQAATKLRVRINQDGTEIVATIEQPDGSSKVLRAATCAKLDEQLVSAVAVALDRNGSAAPKAAPERRLRVLDRPQDGLGLVTVQLRATDGRALEISRVTQQSVIVGYSSSAAAMSFETLCRVPCTAHLPTGMNRLLVHDLATDYSATQDATINVNSTLDLHYTSHANARQSTWSRAKWGLLIGTVVGAVAFGAILEAEGSPSLWLHTLDPLMGFSTTGLIGGAIGYATGPHDFQDEANITVHPGLGDATIGRF